MKTFDGITPQSSLTDVLKLSPASSVKLLHLLDVVMSGDGALTRGEREAIAAAVSNRNDVAYCVFYHSMFSEAFDGDIGQTNERLRPLLTYARRLNAAGPDALEQAFADAVDAGWSEKALFEVVEVCGVFNMINTIVRAAGLARPPALPGPAPNREDLSGGYLNMAKAVAGDS